MHIVRDDSILGSLRFVSKYDEYQMYGALLPEWMTNHQVQDSPVYKTYLAFATKVVTHEKARKFKKPTSPLKKKALVDVEEPVEKLVKKPAARRQSTSVQIKDTPGGSSEGANLESEVPDELKGKSIKGTGLKLGVLDVSKVDSSESKYESYGYSDDDDQQSDDEQTESDDDKSDDLNKTEDEEKDKFVHTPDDYVPTDDENIDDDEFEQIIEEMYSDVNVELKDSKRKGKEKDDEEITDASHVEAEYENVIQEVASDQVKDDAQATVTAALATQKTTVLLQSSSILSDYALKFINFDNIPSGDTKIISMMDVKVQHEYPSIQTSPLLTVLIMSIKLGKGSIRAKNVDYSLALLATIKYEVLNVVQEYLGTSLDDALYKKSAKDIRKINLEHAEKQQEPKYTIISFNVDVL
nr:hypothetical protein [Tanacetum cinerariifolium]